MDPLNRTTGPAIIRFFDVCFKRGVLDAYEAGDNNAVLEFVDAHRGRWTFGTIGEDSQIDWRAYRFVLYKWARENGLTSLAEKYLIAIRKKNYLWCLLPYCMWFYVMGASEWLAYPSSSRIEIFKMNKREHWDVNAPVKKFTRMDYISLMHEACFAYKKNAGDDEEVNPAILDNYAQAIFDLTRSYVR